MSRRFLFIGLVCLAWSWAIGVNSAAAQPIAKLAKLDKLKPMVKRVVGWFDVMNARPEPGITLPSPHYLRHPPQYFPPSDPYPPPKELRSLEDAAKVAYGDPAPPVSKPELPVVKPESSPKERAIEYRLRQPISLNFKDVPLEQAAKDISIVSGIPVLLDYAALDDARINLDATISISVDNIDMKSALKLMLNRLRLTYVIENDALKITTEEKRLGPLLRKTYKVADILAPMPAFEGQKQKQDKSYDAILIDLITSTVFKNTWESMGGNGSIQFFPKDKTLIVNQPQEIQEEVQLLLTTLRRMQGLTVSAEVRFVQVSLETAQRWRKDMAEHGKPVDSFREEMSRVDFVNPVGSRYVAEKSESTKGPRRFVALESSQVQQLLEIAQAGSIIQAPKLSVFNGQNVPFNCVRKEVMVTEFKTKVDEKEDGAILSAQAKIVGWRCELQPVVSTDRRSVRLSMNVEHFTKDEATSVERSTKAAKIFNVSDGSTLVWDLGEAAGRTHLFVLVTPRIHEVREDEPNIFQGEVTPIPVR